jgi:hypothetical protein
MKNKSFRHAMVLAAASLLAGLSLPTPSRADTVSSGYDLFTTVAAGTFYDAPGLDLGNLQGVPLNTYNFGAPYGLQNVGSTDTIIQRLAPGTTLPGTFNLQVDALQLETVAPISLFGGQYAFVTLDPSEVSSGTMSINAGTPGTFTSTLNVYFDVYVGSSFVAALTTTPVATGQEETFTSSGTWSSNAPPGALLIPGVNYELDGSDTSEDFWPAAAVVETSPDANHEVDPTVPDATSTLALVLMPLGLVALAAARGKVARRA